MPLTHRTPDNLTSEPTDEEQIAGVVELSQLSKPMDWNSGVVPARVGRRSEEAELGSLQRRAGTATQVKVVGRHHLREHRTGVNGEHGRVGVALGEVGQHQPGAPGLAGISTAWPAVRWARSGRQSLTVYSCGHWGIVRANFHHTLAM